MLECKSMWLCVVGIGIAVILFIALYAGFVIGPTFLVNKKPEIQEKTIGFNKVLRSGNTQVVVHTKSV